MSSIHRFFVAFVFLLTFTFQLPLAAAQDAAEPFDWQPEWHSTSAFDGLLAGGLFAGGAGIHFGINEPQTPRWEGPILADDAARNALMAGSESGLEGASTASDVLLTGLVTAPLLLQPGVAYLGYDNGRAAGDALLMNAQSLGMTFLATTAVKHLVGRERPAYGECYDDPNAPGCEDRETLSFPSGHTSMAFAGAGLMCLNNEKFNTFGGGWDRATCYGALGAAAGVGALRIASNSHYLSDVIAGAGLGLLTGYLVPKLLFFGDESSPAPFSEVNGSLGPQLGEVKGLNFSFTW